jgi:hypothetical protein
MMDWLKQMTIYAIIVATLWVGIVYLPRYRRVAVSSDYSNEILGIDMVKDYPLDETATLATLQHGDAICYRLARDGELAVRLGWIAGLPGDVIATNAEGKITINGKISTRTMPGPPYGPLLVPAGHFMVVTDGHGFDSLARGPLPAIALRGRIGVLP